MQQLFIIIHILVALAIIALVLLQHGKGADMGAAFGGASSTMFGSQGATPFLVKLTASLAVVFFLTCLGINYFVSEKPKESSVVIPAGVNQPYHIPTNEESP